MAYPFPKRAPRWFARYFGQPRRGRNLPATDGKSAGTIAYAIAWPCAPTPSAELLGYINATMATAILPPACVKPAPSCALDVSAGVSAPCQRHGRCAQKPHRNSPVPARSGPAFAEVKSLQGGMRNWRCFHGRAGVGIGAPVGAACSGAAGFRFQLIAAAMAPWYLKTMSDRMAIPATSSCRNPDEPTVQPFHSCRCLSMTSSVARFTAIRRWRLSQLCGLYRNRSGKLYLTPSQYLVRNPDRDQPVGNMALSSRQFRRLGSGFLRFTAQGPVAALPDLTLNQGCGRLLPPGLSRQYQSLWLELQHRMGWECPCR